MSYQDNKRRERELRKEMMEQDRRIARENLKRRQNGEPVIEQPPVPGTKSADNINNKVESVPLKPSPVQEPAIKISISRSDSDSAPNVYTRKGVLMSSQANQPETPPSDEPSDPTVL